MDNQTQTHRDVAYYYPAPFWGPQASDWVKSLLLFFDQVAILLPDYMYGRHQAADPTLVEPLEDRGLLSVFEPKEWVDEDLANQLAEIIVELLTNGAFDDLPKEAFFQEISRSRLGYGADISLANFLVDELADKGLARPSEDGVSVPLHPTVRTTILIILGQLSRIAGAKRGLIVHPTTNDSKVVTDLIATLSRESMPSRGRVITLDLESASLNMASVPLDDVLQFRDEHKVHYQLYMSNLRKYLAELASIDNAEEREALLVERSQEIADLAHDIRRTTKKWIGKNLPSLSIGLVGSAWIYASGDPIGAALNASGHLLNFWGERKKVTAYSYLFEARSRFRA